MLAIPMDLYAQDNDLKTEIEKIIRFDTDIDFKKNPGFIVGIIDNDSTYFFSFGSKNLKSHESLVKDDIFEVGSVTKVFTACLVSILADNGTLQYSDKINAYLPETYRNPRMENVTIHDLVVHQSGLPKRPSFFGRKEKDSQNPYAHYKVSDLLSFYSDFIPEKKHFEYSHINYALLEVIITHLLQKEWEDIMQEYIFEPLNMSRSFVDFPEKRTELVTPGYDRAGKNTTPWSFGSFKGSEGVKTSAGDMVTFLKVNMKMTGHEIEKIFDKNFTPQITESFNQQLNVGMGWQLINMNYFNIATHTGKTTGHNAFIGLVRETKTGVVVFANSSVGTEDLGLQILRMINYNWKRINLSKTQ